MRFTEHFYHRTPRRSTSFCGDAAEDRTYAKQNQQIESATGTWEFSHDLQAPNRRVEIVTLYLVPLPHDGTSIYRTGLSISL
jgi:hypothetical protein